MPQSREQNRVIDPVLSNVALGYKDDEFIAHHLFPDVVMPTSGAKVIKFGKESFLKYNMRRAPGSKTARVQYGHVTDPVSFYQDALDGVVPREFLRDLTGATRPMINREAQAVNSTMRIMRRGLEIEAAGLAMDAANYDANHKDTLSGTDQWDNASSNPLDKIDSYQEAIRASIGAYANTLILPSKAFKAVRRHNVLKEQFKYTDSKSITVDMLAGYLDIPKVVVGRSIYAEDENSDFLDIWNHAVLAYIPPQGQMIDSPSYGYNYVGEDMPLVEDPWFDKTCKSWIYPVEYERRPYITSQAAGFLIQNPISG